MENINFEGQPVNPEQNSSQNMNQNSDQNMNLNEAPRSGGAPNDGSSDEGKRKKKLIWAGVILAALILAVASWQYWQYTHSVYYQQMKAVKKLEAMERESDKYGGKTPEETVRLFTEAVKKGDFELASKYGNREQILPVLEKMKTEGKIENLINWLKAGEIKMFAGGGDANLMIKEGTREFWVLSMHKSESGTWKIDEF